MYVLICNTYLICSCVYYMLHVNFYTYLIDKYKFKFVLNKNSVS